MVFDNISSNKKFFYVALATNEFSRVFHRTGLVKDDFLSRQRQLKIQLSLTRQENS